MIIDEVGIEFVKKREGYKDTAYQDQAGVWTIGYGTTKIDGRRVSPNESCDIIEATKWLGADLLDSERFVTKVVKVKINQNQFNALVSLAYNIGHAGFKNSTLLRKLNSKQPLFEDLFTRWCKVTINGKKIRSDGLYNRRVKEWLLFNKK